MTRPVAEVTFADSQAHLGLGYTVKNAFGVVLFCHGECVQSSVNCLVSDGKCRTIRTVTYKTFDSSAYMTKKEINIKHAWLKYVITLLQGRQIRHANI